MMLGGRQKGMANLVTLLINYKILVMATKKKPANRIVKRWFSRILPIREENKGLTLSQKKAKVRKEITKILANVQNGRKWQIKEPLKFEKASGNRLKLTVFVISRRGPAPGPNDAPVSAPKSPPPSS
jgi:hypothetical protein